MNSPVYTKENQCQDCYKCVRHCPVKAIRIVNGSASVIPEACVACGECVKVCPVQAKKVRSDLSRLRTLLDSGAKVYASVAPSYSGYFKGVSINRISGALRELGFAGVSETAHGAEAVSAQVSHLLEENPRTSVMISSTCPAVVDFIRMYKPEWAPFISPVLSPVRAHSQILREKFGKDIKVVFFGPCAAKKNESDRNPDELSLAVTFASLERFFEERGVLLEYCKDAPLELGAANEGRFYPVEGGMNDTLRDGGKVRYVSVSGLTALKRMLSETPPARETDGRPLFIEALACRGGCVNGPVMKNACSLSTLLEIDARSPIKVSGNVETPVNTITNYVPNGVEKPKHTEVEIASALARVGKFKKSDELNCGACGYESCRAFAKAMLDGKAEENMCHTYLKQNFQRTSNALIRYIPAGVVIVNGEGLVIEANRQFAELVGATVEYETLGSLEGLPIEALMPEFAQFFTSALKHGSEVERFRQGLKDRLVNVSVFPIALGESAGAVIQDVTKNEFKREQVAAKARDIIRKNVLTVQEVARLFGEHIAETEIMLNEIAGTYESKTVGVSYNGGDSDEYLNG